MKKLPLKIPYISTIPEHSNIMAVIGRGSPNWLWFLNYFIQLRINKDVRNKLCLNFCYGHNYKLVEDIPILETYSLPRDILRVCGNVWETVCELYWKTRYWQIEERERIFLENYLYTEDRAGEYA